MRFVTYLFATYCIAAPLTALSAQPETVKSNFGFEVMLPAGWVQLGPNQASKRAPSAELVGLEKVNQKEIELIIGRVKSKKIEFYLDTLHSDEAFTNNISLQLEDEANDYSQYTKEEIQTYCAGAPADLKKMWGEAVNFKGCGVVSSNGVAMFAFSYIVPTQGKFILQYVIPFSNKQTMVLVGGGRLDNDGVVRMQAAIRAIAVGITGRAK